MCAPFWLGAEIDDAFEARREELLDAVVAQPDDLLDAGHADAGEAHLDAGRWAWTSTASGSAVP